MPSARLAAFEAEALARRAEEAGGLRLVIGALADRDANALKLMAQTIAAKPGHVAVLLSQNLPLSIVVARSGDAPVDASRLLKTLTERFGGKGGGRPEMAQGGGLDASAESVAAAARALLSSAASDD